MGALAGVMTFGWCALVAGLVARLVTLSGRRITYNAPVSLHTEVWLNCIGLIFGPVVGVAGVAGLIVGASTSSAVFAWVTAVGVTASLAVPGIRLARRLVVSDLARAGQRRKARYPTRPEVW